MLDGGPHSKFVRVTLGCAFGAALVVLLGVVAFQPMRAEEIAPLFPEFEAQGDQYELPSRKPPVETKRTSTPEWSRFRSEIDALRERPRVAQRPPNVERVPVPPRPDAGVGGQDPRVLPTPSPFREDRVRLPLLPYAATPKPNEQTREKFAKYVDRTLDVENVFDVVEGRPRLLLLKQPPLRIQIGDEDVADYQLVTETEISVSGKTSGTTVLNLWFADPANPNRQDVLSYLVRVTPDPEQKARLEAVYEALEDEINRNFPDSVVRLSLVGDRLLIRGQAKDVEEATAILRIVGDNAPDGPETIPLEELNVVAVPNVDGSFDEGALENFLLRTDTSVVNMLRIPGHQQVLLKVTVAEVNRSAARAIGANLAVGSLGNAASFLSFLPAGDPGGTAGSLASVVGGALNGGTFFVNRGDFKLALNALKSLNLARTLAEPNLVTINGKPATFQAGGSFPTTTVTGATAIGLQGVVFNNTGVQLQFLPIILDGDRIRLTVNAAVSAIDDANFNDTGNPTLQQRQFASIVELRDGETLAVAGLLNNSFGATSNRVPFAGDVPVLGRLFSNDTTSYDEQELVFLVTPHLVSPLPENSHVPLPGADVFEPDDVEFYLLGRIEGCRAEDYRSAVRTDLAKMKAFRRCQQQFVIGPTGHADGRH